MPPTNELQPTPARARSGTRGTSPTVIAKIQQYDPALSASQIQKKLVNDGICSIDDVPSVSTINEYKKKKSQDGPQRSTGKRAT